MVTFLWVTRWMSIIVNAWLYFLWVTRWIILHGDFLVGNKMDVNIVLHGDFLVGNKMDVNVAW